MSTAWFNYEGQHDEVYIWKIVHVNRMILCNRKPHPNRLNEFADEIKSTRRKQTYSVWSMHSWRRTSEFQVGVCPFHWLFPARIWKEALKNRLDKFCAKSSKKNKHKMNMHHIGFRWKFWREIETAENQANMRQIQCLCTNMRCKNNEQRSQWRENAFFYSACSCAAKSESIDLINIW